MEEKISSEFKDAKNSKTNFYIELALFLILGILIGVTLKGEAVKKITIGFDDYKMKFFSHNYDINGMQDEQIQKIINEQSQAENDQNYKENN